jgi:hypothetical protein
MSLTPFTVDPAVMASIRPMASIDAAPVGRLHHAAMGQSTWAKLGPDFLTALYTALIDDHRFLGFVYQEDGAVRGFIAGSQDTSAMMSATFRRMWPALALAAFPQILNPKIWGSLLGTARYAEVSGNQGMAESLFCSFEPGLRGKRIAGHINKVLFDELLARGHGHVCVTTEVDNVGANRQLKSWGFENAAQFQFYQKTMIRYVLDLQASERVQANSTHPAI